MAVFAISVWYLWGFFGIVSSWDPKFPPTSLPLPFLPPAVDAVVGLLLMTWGMVALWWLVFQHERSSVREIALPWWGGLIAGTLMTVYWLRRCGGSDGQNDEYVVIPPLVFLLAFEVSLLIRMSLNGWGKSRPRQ
jgi:apolipoprotein N-acyltransferase